MDSSKKSNLNYYSIGSVARLTGITVHTLRVWEQRYNAIKAERTISGRRQYTSRDVDRLISLKFLVDRGCPISSIATLSERQLKKKLDEFTSQNVSSNLSTKKGKPTIAIFGEYLPIKIKKMNHALDDFSIVFCGSDIDSFKADACRIKPNILVLEFPLIDEYVGRLVNELGRLTNARRIIIVYSFARSIDIEKLNDDITKTMKGPVTLGEIFNTIKLQSSAIPITRTESIEVKTEKPTKFTAPAKRFSRNELAVLGNVTSSIACECPQHLTELVTGLSNFEDYSAQCVSRSPDDAELHAYLQSTTANCRASMEKALEKVALAEGIDLKNLS